MIILYLCSSAHEAQFPRDDFLFAAGQYASDAVGLGDQCAVDERKRHPRHDASRAASRRRWLSYQRERGGVGERQPHQDEVAEFARGRLDDGSVVVLPEDGRDDRRGD